MTSSHHVLIADWVLAKFTAAVSNPDHRPMCAIWSADHDYHDYHDYVLATRIGTQEVAGRAAGTSHFHRPI